MKVRHPALIECAALQAAVQGLVDETYAFIWPSGAPPIDAADWTRGWIAEIDGSFAGIVLTEEDWVEDLWIVAPHRCTGIGSALLALAEREIASRDHAHARLRVVAGNERALAFYRKRGWQFVQRRQHEHLPVEMITLCKPLVEAPPSR